MSASLGCLARGFITSGQDKTLKTRILSYLDGDGRKEKALELVSDG